MQKKGLNLKMGDVGMQFLLASHKVYINLKRGVG